MIIIFVVIRVVLVVVIGVIIVFSEVCERWFLAEIEVNRGGLIVEPFVQDVVVDVVEREAREIRVGK